MDEQVMGAMQKWPNVPAVYGWLSLGAQGDWLLHNHGGAREGETGQKIANEQIRHFMNRNYAATPAGEWYFQNGPQRVFVDLVCAPFIARLADDLQTLVTHNELPITRINQWLLDEQGHLYLRTEHGAAMLAGRDMELLTARLKVLDEKTATFTSAQPDKPTAQAVNDNGNATALGASHLQALEDGETLQVSLNNASALTAPMQWVQSSQVPAQLGFVPVPTAR
ncbi:hypothetical protein W822_20915 [Advenella kashmirensis W13003]|uniref:DUF2946 domain-containing protein n=1 Tax=Advenella kashmirensis W13003 TaxID=1424334 RepID=V8QMD8_9BURK|nr:DUF2946 family protein [Advenella kashmirensis]ETF00827.1 hypothetical protein W822_20915 [Advenella kashmirensis W13003]